MKYLKVNILKKKLMVKKIFLGILMINCSLTFENYTYENINYFRRSLDLSKVPLIRVGFVKNEMVLIDIHRIICDRNSIFIIKNELNNYYNDVENQPLEIQFRDYAIHLNETNKNNFTCCQHINKNIREQINNYVKNNGVSKTAFFF